MIIIINKIINNRNKLKINVLDASNQVIGQENVLKKILYQDLMNKNKIFKLVMVEKDLMDVKEIVLEHDHKVDKNLILPVINVA